MFKRTAHARCVLALLLLSACGDDDQASESAADSGVVPATDAAAESDVVLAADPSTACPAPLERCGGECVDTRSSVHHCGECATACGHGERCSDGRCEACAPQPLSGSLPIEVDLDTRELEDVVRGSCGLGEAPEALFAFVAPHAGKYAFSTAGSLFNTVLYVLDERCGGAELACSDDRGGGLASMVELDLEADQAITVVVDGFDGQAGQARLEVSELAQSSCCTARTEPGCGVTFVEACVCAQDEFCCTYAWDEACTALAASEACSSACGEAPDACQPAADGGTVPATLAGAIEETDGLAPSCASAAAPEVLFAFTAPVAGLYEFDTIGSEVTDTIVAVLDGATCAGAEIACVDDVGDELAARASVALEAGQQVLVAVESWDLDRGEVEVTVREADDLAQVCDAAALTGGLPLSAAADVSSAPSRIEPSCATFGSAGETLFAFTAPATARYRFDTAGSTADTIVQVLDGSCAGAELGCNDDPSEALLAAMVEVELAAGQTVIVNVDSVIAENAFELSVSEVQ
jgi:hypothetical protein